MLIVCESSSHFVNYLKNPIFDMKVHLIRKETIESYTRDNAQSRTGFEEWCTKLNTLIGMFLKICKTPSQVQIY